MDKQRDTNDKTTADNLPLDWKWLALFTAPDGLTGPQAAQWGAWMAEAVHAEELAVLRHWAHRGDLAA